MRMGCWLVLTSLMVGGSGCGKKRVEVGPAIGGVEGGVKRGGARASGCPSRSSASSGAVVEVLDAGAEPREPLRLRPTLGSQGGFRMRMRMNLEMDMSIGGERIPFPIPVIPAFFFDVRTEILSVESDGVFCASLAFVDVQFEETAGVDPAMVSALEQGFVGIVGMKGYSLSTGTGQSLGLRYDRVADTQLQQQLDQFSTSAQNLSAPLPEVPVGVGARWSVESPVGANGLHLLQRTVYTLVERQGDVLVLDAEVEQRLDPAQSLALPGLPPDTAVDISRLSSSGGGQLRLDLQGALPLDSTVQIHLDMGTDILMEDQNVSMNMVMDMAVSTQPLP